MKSWLKWLAALLAVIVVLGGTLLVLPFLIDFNRFKPQIQSAVAERMNAKVDFSSARLTILTGLGVKLNDVLVENTDPVFQGTRLFSVKEVLFRAELIPLLRKKFVGEVLIDKPEIVLATKGLASNVTSLMKPSTSAPESPQETSEASPQKGEKPLLDLKKDVVIKTIKITNAAFTIRSLQNSTQEPVRVRDLNLIVNNIGLDRDIKIFLSTKADLSQPGLKVHGPVRLDATTHVNVDLNTKTLQSITFGAILNLDGLAINGRDAFVKSGKIPLNVKLSGSATPNSAKLDSLQLTLHTLAVTLQADISDLKSLQTTATLKVLSGNLQDLGEVLPQHKALLANATLNLNAHANGAFKDPKSVKAGLALKTILGESDLSIDATLDGIEPPKATLAINSRKLNMGAILKPFLTSQARNDGATDSTLPPSQENSPTAANVAPESSNKESEPGLPPEVKKMLNGALISAKINLNEILYDKFKVENFVVDFQQESLTATLNRFALNTQGIALDMNAVANLAPTPPTVRAKVGLNAGKVNVDELMAKLGVKPATESATPTQPAAPADKASQADEATPGKVTETAPEKEFALTPDQKRLLQGVNAGVSVRIASLSYSKTNLDNIILDAQLANLRAAVEKFSVSGFGGTVDFAGDANLNATPLAYKAKVGLRKIRVEKLIEFLKPEHKDLLKGAATILLDATGAGVTKASIEKRLNAQGTFELQEGELNSKSIAALAQGEFDKFLGGLSLLTVADNAFKAAEKLLENPLAKQALGKSGFNLGKVKGDYERIKTVKISDKATFDKSLKDVRGNLKIQNGRIHITSKKESVDGTLNLDVSVGLDTTLGGGAVYGFSPAIKQKMVTQSKHAALLFDEKGNLDLHMLMGGTVSNPGVKIDFNPIRDRFAKNAQTAMEREAKKGVEDLFNKSIKGKVDAATADLKKKLAEETSKRQAELKKAQDEAKKKAETEGKKKAQEAGKKALKGILGH